MLRRALFPGRELGREYSIRALIFLNQLSSLVPPERIHETDSYGFSLMSAMIFLWGEGEIPIVSYVSTKNSGTAELRNTATG